MTIPYFPGSGRRKHYWRVRPEGLRDLLIKQRWALRGAYSEKRIGRRRIMMTTATEANEFFLVCFRDKDDYWSEATAAARADEAEQRRLVAVKPKDQGRRTERRCAARRAVAADRSSD